METVDKPKWNYSRECIFRFKNFVAVVFFVRSKIRQKVQWICLVNERFYMHYIFHWMPFGWFLSMAEWMSSQFLYHNRLVHSSTLQYYLSDDEVDILDAMMMSVQWPNLFFFGSSSRCICSFSIWRKHEPQMIFFILLSLFSIIFCQCFFTIVVCGVCLWLSLLSLVDVHLAVRGKSFNFLWVCMWMRFMQPNFN